ncbi:hypothetical protein C8R45DRAFT_1111179 [Mycena sanguinolenta]|nr:hypothetical protein C8R45DRAFT_1111179 [Mycena sanguinolenta]
MLFALLTRHHAPTALLVHASTTLAFAHLPLHHPPHHRTACRPALGVLATAALFFCTPTAACVCPSPPRFARPPSPPAARPPRMPCQLLTPCAVPHAPFHAHAAPPLHALYLRCVTRAPPVLDTLHLRTRSTRGARLWLASCPRYRSSSPPTLLLAVSLHQSSLPPPCRLPLQPYLAFLVCVPVAHVRAATHCPCVPGRRLWACSPTHRSYSPPPVTCGRARPSPSLVRSLTAPARPPTANW